MSAAVAPMPLPHRRSPARPAQVSADVPAPVRARITRRRRTWRVLIVAAVLLGLGAGLVGAADERAAVADLVAGSSLEQGLRDALEVGDLGRAGALVRAGADLDHRFADGQRAVDVAVAACDADAVALLIRAGASTELLIRGAVRDPVASVAAAVCGREMLAAVRGLVP